jgi:hypothetical protein
LEPQCVNKMLIIIAESHTGPLQIYASSGECGLKGAPGRHRQIPRKARDALSKLGQARLPFPMCARSRIPSAISSMFKGPTRIAESPATSCKVAPLPNNGTTPREIASAAGKPKPSSRLGNTNPLACRRANEADCRSRSFN